MQPIYLICAVLFVWSLVLTVLLFKLHTHYRNLTNGVSKKDLISSLNHLIALSDSNSESINKLQESLKSEIEQNKDHFQKLGFVRFNPFTDTGGDQSFSMCLLDENNNGFVISSLHSRENTRLYAKSLQSGKPEGEVVLSKEELAVIKRALSNK